MIYKFKSKAAGDVIMLRPHGDQLLRLIGREPAAKGIIEVADMPAAMRRSRRSLPRSRAREADRRRPMMASRRERGVGLQASACGRWSRCSSARMQPVSRSCGASEGHQHRAGAAMKLWSDSFGNGDAHSRHVTPRAAWTPRAAVGFSDNLNPHLAWSDAARRHDARWC